MRQGRAETSDRLVNRVKKTHTIIKNENVELIIKRECQKWLTKYIDGKEATQMYCTKCMLKRGSLIS